MHQNDNEEQLPQDEETLNAGSEEPTEEMEDDSDDIDEDEEENDEDIDPENFGREHFEDDDEESQDEALARGN